MSDNKNSKQPKAGPAVPGVGGAVEKPKNFTKTIGELAHYCKSYLPVIIIAVISAITGTIFKVMGPDRVKDMTNEIMMGLQGSMNMDAITTIAWTLLFFYTGAFLLIYVQNFIMATLTQRIARRMRTDIAQKINRLPLRYFDKTSYGDVLSLMTNDVDTIGQTLNQSVGALVTATTLLIGVLIMMFSINWILALVSVGTVAIGGVLMRLILKKSQRYFKIQQAELGNINGYIEEVYSGHNVVKVYNGAKAARESFEEINGNLFASAWKAQFLSGLMMPLMFFIGNGGYVAVCVIGAMLALNGHITFGVIVAFMIYVRLFTQPLAQIAQAFNNLQRTAAACERVFEFLDEEELEDEQYKTQQLENVRGDVEFRNVRFGHTPDKIIIQNFSSQARAGQKIAIVGPTGAGKTTIVNLLMRFYELNDGEILLDGTPTSRVTRENVDSQFSMVLQDVWLFEGTVKENIIFSKQGVSDEDVVAACKTVGAHSFIKKMPNGYDTVLNDKAVLSEGQKQLLTIARAMVQNAPLLILDEATSSVDTRTERIVQQAMDKLTKGRTSFVIAHRLSTIKNADLILVMKDGDIIESGNHEELLQKGGFYAELYNSQFSLAG